MTVAAPVPRDFVRAAPSPVLPPPRFTRGPVAWARANLFSGVWSTLFTFLSIAFLAWALPQLARYLVIDAVWVASDGGPCRAPGAGACWAYVAQKASYFMYGSYPRDQVWRVDIVMAFGAFFIAWLLWPSAPRRGLGALLFFVVFPFFAFALLTGLNPFGVHRAVGWGLDHMRAAPGQALDLGKAVFRDLEMIARGPLRVFDVLASLGRIGFDVVVLLGLAIALLAAAVGALALLLRNTVPTLAAVGLVALIAEASRPVEAAWDRIGLTHVPTDLWGGVFVSLLVSVVGIVFSLPGGVLLALGRRSRLPMVKFCSVAFIEFVRGVPLITVLFMANLMLPLFVPAEWTPDRFVRPLIGIALFASAYMAEVVRGGLQAMPRGQFEGAMAIGLGYWRTMRLVILPQALTIVIPGIVNTFIGLFKDTTLVAIVGISDFLRAVETQRLDAAWAGPTISTTGYLFAALFYFVFCFGMSRYSMFVERRMAAGQKR